MMDKITSEIIKNALVALGEEMFNIMIRTSMSPIIYEAADFAVGITSVKGSLLAQGNGVAGFLASLDTAVVSTLERYSNEDDIKPGDVFITNSPYDGGGTHLNDIVIIYPVFYQNRLIAFTVNKAHWIDVGGAQPGSVSTSAREIFSEGLQFRFLKLYESGNINQTLMGIIRENVRLPESILGDMHAAVASCRAGANRVVELCDKYGLDIMLQAMEEMLDYGEKMTRIEIGDMPQGVYEAEDVVEDDGYGNGPFTIKVKVTIADEKFVVDFTGTHEQVLGPVNCAYVVLLTGMRCIFKAVTDPNLPVNGGCFRLLDVICPPGTIISAESPAPVSLYHEPVLAAIDVVWKAIAPVFPGRLPAGHHRTVGVTFISGMHPEAGDLFVLGQSLVGGWGASCDMDGDNGQFSCGHGVSYNIPVEIFESRYGLQVEQYTFHNEDGGAGEFRGGKGVMLDYRVTSEEVFLTHAVTRTTSRPWGLKGGQEGSNNYVEVLRENGDTHRFHMCSSVPVKKNEVIRLMTATGGGYGDPTDRPEEVIRSDIRNGYITPEQARQYYQYQSVAECS